MNGVYWEMKSQVFLLPLQHPPITSLASSRVPSCVCGPTCPLADDFDNGWREVTNSVGAFLRVMDMTLPASVCMLLQNLVGEEFS